MTKYNNYADRGGDGVNKLAILDPNASMPDFLFANPVMKEVLTIKGRTPDPRFSFLCQVQFENGALIQLLSIRLRSQSSLIAKTVSYIDGI